jgi:hypothetical protein
MYHQPSCAIISSADIRHADLILPLSSSLAILVSTIIQFEILQEADSSEI